MTPTVLCSFHYFRKIDIASIVREAGGKDHLDVFADSGAFSALNAGANITVPDYCAWLLDNQDGVNFAAALDVIGDWKATKANADKMRDALGDKVKVVPTFHVGTPWHVLDDMLKDYDFIALGGAVAVNRRNQAVIQWLTHAHKVLRDNGSVAHGFGLTRPPYPTLFPFYSVDSSFWMYGQRTGNIHLWDDVRRDFVHVCAGKPLNVDEARLVREYGGDPVAFQKRGFGHVGRSEDKDLARAQSRWLSEASAVTAWRNLAYLRSVKEPVPRPSHVVGDGLKVYLACSPADIKLAVQTHAQVFQEVSV